MEVPASFVAMPRWWHDAAGRTWLAEIPGRLAALLARWGLEPERSGGTGAWHGSNALVVPVRRGSELLALRLSPPGDDLAAEAAALRFWAGRGTVRLRELDLDGQAMLLERLDGDRSLARLPLDHAVPVLGALMRRLAVPVPVALAGSVPSTAAVAASDAARLAGEQERVAELCGPRQLAEVLGAAARLAGREVDDVAVDGDLHHAQVLAGTREPWLVVDPVLLRGDVEYDLGRVLWSRLDEMVTDAEVERHFATVVQAAAVPADRARDWVLTRSLSYLLWGLDHGLTEDPVRCRRLLRIFA